MHAKTLLALALVTLPAESATEAQENSMQHAQGEFEVQLTARDLDGPSEDPNLRRLAIVKQLRGDLVGSGHGQRLAAGGPGRGFGAYVALERINGSLNGKEGSFLLVHRGTIDVSVMDG